MTNTMTHVWQEMTDCCCNPQCRANRNSSSANEPCPCPWSWPTQDSRSSKELISRLRKLREKAKPGSWSIWPGNAFYIYSGHGREPYDGQKVAHGDPVDMEYVLALHQAFDVIVGELDNSAHEPPAVLQSVQTMFRAAVSSLAEISQALDIPDHVASVANGNAEILKAIAHLKRAAQPPEVVARPLSEWSEAQGPVVWWAPPVREPSYIGQPGDSDWPGYHTHWTPHPKVPSNIKEQQCVCGSYFLGPDAVELQDSYGGKHYPKNPCTAPTKPDAPKFGCTHSHTSYPCPKCSGSGEEESRE